MPAQEKKRWKIWADRLRQEMMIGLVPEVTKSVEVIASETHSIKSASTLNGTKFWKACQEGKSPNDMLALAGFEIEFEPDEERKVCAVTLRLNPTWMGIMQQVLDRKRS